MPSHRRRPQRLWVTATPVFLEGYRRRHTTDGVTASGRDFGIVGVPCTGAAKAAPLLTRTGS